MRFAKVATLGLVAFVALACGGITIPSIPPIPSFPPIILPSGETLPPGVIPSASGTCALVSSDEISSAMGSPATLTSADGGDCTFTFSNFATVVVSVESGSDLTGARFIMGNTAQDLQVAGLPAVSGQIFGLPAVYVQRGTQQLSVLGFLAGNDVAASTAKLVQIASIAVTRIPG